MKKIPINTTPGGLAYGIKASYFKNASLTTLTGGGHHFPCSGVLEVFEEDSQCLRGRDLQDDIRPARKAFLGELPREA